MKYSPWVESGRVVIGNTGHADCVQIVSNLTVQFALSYSEEPGLGDL